MNMEPISKLKKKHLKNIRMIVFDVDGVIVPRGTKIKQVGNTTTLETKVIEGVEIAHIKELNKKGYLINISSGRGLYMLQEMFREILPFVSLTYENGSATWYQGKLYQHVNSFAKLKDLIPKLKQIKNKNIKGFEPKEFIITIHSTKRVKEIEEIMKKEDLLYSIWNGEAYDIGVKKYQTKAAGLRQVMKIFKLKKENIMAIGDNYNDSELLSEVEIAVSADKKRAGGKFYIPLQGADLPAEKLMEKILSLGANYETR